MTKEWKVGDRVVIIEDWAKGKAATIVRIESLFLNTHPYGIHFDPPMTNGWIDTYIDFDSMIEESLYNSKLYKVLE